MLKIICPHCGGIHKGKEVVTVKYDVTEGNVKYKAYALSCKHCGKRFDNEKCAEHTAQNRQKAINKYKLTHKKATGVKTHFKSEAKIREEARNMSDQSAKLLLAAIVRTAVVDGHKKKYKKDVRDFFNSQWGQDVCEGLETTMKVCDNVDAKVDPKVILNCIEKGKVNIKVIDNEV